jgi:transcriptional regulator with XRE-family HTH domain
MRKTLREHRIDRMKTYRGLADASGVAVTTITAVERSTRRPHFATMSAIAGALGVPVRSVAEFDDVLEARVSSEAA